MTHEQLPQGWLTEPEAEELRRLAKGKTVLELGAWKGRSTIVLSDAARYVISVDRHQGIGSSYPEDSLPEYLESVRDRQNVAIVIGEFGVFTRLLGKIDFVYVDGDHDEESVRRDTESALLVKPEIIAYHDWDFESVRAGVSVLDRAPDAVVGSVASFLIRR